MKHYPHNDEESTACCAMRLIVAQQNNELTEYPELVDCPGCVESLVTDGVLIVRGVAA